MISSDKWLLGAKSQIDQLRADLEDNYLPIIFSLAEAIDESADADYNLSKKLARLFIFEMFAGKIETGCPFRCGHPIEDFKAFLNSEPDNGDGPVGEQPIQSSS